MTMCDLSNLGIYILASLQHAVQVMKRLSNSSGSQRNSYYSGWRSQSTETVSLGPKLRTGFIIVFRCNIALVFQSVSMLGCQQVYFSQRE